MENKKERISIYTDGSCPNNPGGIGGYGVVIVLDNKLIKLHGYIEEPTTCNRAEIMAVLAALMKAKSLGFTYLRIFSDSQYVVKTLKGLYDRKKNKDLWQLIDLASIGMKVHYEWVRGHNGDFHNELADQLAAEGRIMYDVNNSMGKARLPF